MKPKWMVRGVALALGVTLLAGAVRAEVIVITGEFPAAYREASYIPTLHVERFAGQDGPALSLAIERALTGSTYDLVAGRTGRDTAEGALSGIVTTGVEETGYKTKEKKCVERDADKKCTKEEEVEVPCRRRVVNLNADLRMVRNSDGRIVYTKGYPYRDEISWCQGQNPSRTVEETVASAIQGIAGSVRAEIAPSVSTYRIRLRESTKGMPKDTARNFKDLIKSSQRDMAAACGQWQAMDQTLPGHPSVLFDLALCAEQRGEYSNAVALYQAAVRAGAVEGNDGAGRAQQLILGREDAAERAKRRRR